MMSTRDNAGNQEGVSTSRLETLTDGVFAIAMTLLVFGLAVPDDLTQDKFYIALGNLLPSLLSLVISFLILGVLWVATHTEFRSIRRADHALMWLNLFFLLAVTLVPFSAGLMGHYHTFKVAVIIYGVNLLFCLFFHLGMWLHATRDRHLVDADLATGFINFGIQLAIFPIAMYSIAIISAFFFTWVSLVLYAITPIPYILGIFYRRLDSIRKASQDSQKRAANQTEMPGKVEAEED
ncbi:MAG TPA: TMEM175 family protein [Ktedonobacteraceae bacterium]|nr:TMEM175 family protein [Ktedonobacteraceae bacterium]